MTAQRRPSEMTARERYELSRKERGITKSDERNAKRQELTKILRGYGYTGKQAHAMRDWKRERLEAAIADRQKQIASKPPSKRTEDEHRELKSIREHQQQVSRGDTAAAWAPFDTEGNRWHNFSRWSVDAKYGGGFPSDAQRYINRLNYDHGEHSEPERPSYGYRVFYHRYVLRKSESEAIAYVENHVS